MTQTRGTQIKGKERTEGKINILGVEKGMKKCVKKENMEREKDLSDGIYRIKKGRKDIKQQHEHTETEGTKGIDIKNQKKNTLKHMAHACEGAVKNSR